MVQLSDYFPENIKKSTFSSELKIGKIMYRYEDKITKPHNKFSIIVGICKEGISVARIYINSGINLNVLNTEYLKQLQIDILIKDYGCLDNDYSFIDCSKIFEITYEELEIEYINNPKEFFKDDLVDELLEKVLDKLANAKTIKPIVKKKYNL